MGQKITQIIFSLIFADFFTDASLVSVMDTAEANFLTEFTENLESKSQSFWIGMFKNLNGIF